MKFPFPSIPEEAPGGRLISFVSCVPGAGASTLACLAAMTLESALIDFTGRVRSYMGLTPDVCPTSLVDALGVGRPEDITKIGVDHPSGVTVFPGVTRTVDASQIDTRLAQKISVYVKRMFAKTVAVLPPLEAAGWATALISDAVCLVVKPDRADMDVFHDRIEFLSRLGCQDRMKIVLNQAGAPGAIRTSEVREIFKPDIVIQFDPDIKMACNRRQLNPGRLKNILKNLEVM